VAKYNQLLRIEDQLGEAAGYRGRSALSGAGARGGRPPDPASEAG
jgi:hypothetical protein